MCSCVCERNGGHEDEFDLSKTALCHISKESRWQTVNILLCLCVCLCVCCFDVPVQHPLSSHPQPWIKHLYNRTQTDIWAAGWPNIPYVVTDISLSSFCTPSSRICYIAFYLKFFVLCYYSIKLKGILYVNIIIFKKCDVIKNISIQYNINI